MAALKTERRVLLWRISPRTSPPEAAGKMGASGSLVVVTLDDIISILESEQTAGRARIYLGDGGRLLEDDDPNREEKNQIYIAEIQRSDGDETITILINRGDPNIASPAFINTEKHTVRVEEPEEKEVPGASAHFVISTKLTTRGHRACFEKMSFVSSTLAMAAMDRIIARACANNPTFKYEITAPDKKGRPRIDWKIYRPTFENSQVPSERLVDDLDEGELSAVTLTKRKTFYAGPGVADVVTRQEEKVVLSLRRTDKATVTQFLKDLTTKAKAEEYDSISFHIDKLPGGATNNPTLTLDDRDAMEQLYVRAKRITDFAIVLEQCYSSICSEIEEKMIEIVKDESW